jgi:hypothetical protein
MLRPLESVMAAPADLIGQYGVLVAAQSGQWEKNLLMLRCVKAWRDFNSRSVRCRQYHALAPSPAVHLRCEGARQPATTAEPDQASPVLLPVRQPA